MMLLGIIDPRALVVFLIVGALFALVICRPPVHIPHYHYKNEGEDK